MRVLIAIPALNEAKVIASTVSVVVDFVSKHLPQHQFLVVVADNGSTDGTAGIVTDLASKRRGCVVLLQLNERGKGRAIRAAWDAYEADAYVFMDADLAVDLAALPALIARIEDGADVAIGSRYHRDSRVKRSWLRRTLSYGYRGLLAVALETNITDLPCGFKAVTNRVARELLPRVEDDRWFFDTELVIRAERAGLRVDEVPVSWREDQPGGRTSKVHVFSLVREYIRRVLGLQRSLGARRDVVAPTVIAVTPFERRFVLGATGVVAVLGLIPPIVGLLWAHKHGWEWNGRQFLAPGDAAIYLNYIHQVKAGHVLLENAATTEKLVPVLNILWLFVGIVARVFWLTPLAAYHVVRTLLLFPMAVAFYAAIAYLFRGARERIVAFLLVMFGSGLGLLASTFFVQRPTATGTYSWPIDMWVAESNVFMSALYSPHFVASWALFVATLVLLLVAYDRRSPRIGVYAGLAALALFQFHPFHAPTIWLVAGLTFVAASLYEGFRLRRFGAFAAFVAVSSPSVAYHYWLTRLTDNGRFMLDNNVNATPNALHVLLGLGAIAGFAVWGWLIERRAGNRALLAPSARRFLVIWAVTNVLIAYAPFVFQRRLLEGAQFPLAILSVPALMLIVRGWPFKGQVRAVVLALGVAFLLLPSSFSALVRSLQAAQNDTSSMHFFSSEKSAALKWLRENTPDDAVVLSTGSLGNDIIGWGERSVYVGHWANTIGLNDKQLEVRDFLAYMTDTERRSFALRHDIDYVVIGPTERNYGGNMEASRGRLWRTYMAGGYEIYKVME